MLADADLEVEISEDVLCRSRDLEREDLLLLAAVQGEDPVAGESLQILIVIVVILIDGFCLCILG